MTRVSYREIERFADARRCAVCHGRLGVRIVAQGQYELFCPSSKGEHKDWELLLTKEEELIEHIQHIRKDLPPLTEEETAQLKKDLWG